MSRLFLFAKADLMPLDTPAVPTENLLPEEAGLVFEQINAAFDIVVQATEDGDLIRFRNAILARVETNKNNDVISPSNIDELAATLSGRAVDIDHDDRLNAGVITASRTVMYQGQPAVAIDGLLWRDRYPAEIDGVRAGTHHLSVEAMAEKAVCSTCNSQFVSSEVYCDHLRQRHLTGAKRGFVGLKGKGAGITPHPAGTNTTFDRTQIYVVAHEETAAPLIKEKVMSPCPHCKTDVEASDKCSKCGKSLTAELLAADLKAAETAVAEKETAATTATAALEAKHVELTRALAELEALKAAKKENPFDKKEEDDESDDDKKKEKKTGVEAALTVAQAALVEKTAQAEVLTAALATKTADFEAAQAKLAAIKSTEREALIKPLLSEAAWTERGATFLAMDDAMFATVAASFKDMTVSKKPALAVGLRSGMPGPGAGSETPKKSLISLR